MLAKPKVLFIGDYCRTDYVSLLKACKSYVKFKFLHFSSEVEEENKFYRQYGEAIYWKDYKSAYKMLQEVKPAKVVFLYIDTYYQAAVNVACKELSVPTYHLEHGLLADYAVALNSALSPSRATPFIHEAKKKIAKAGQLYSRVKSRLFLNNTMKLSSPENASFLRQFIKVRGKNSAFATFKEFKSPKRFTDNYISFSPRIFKVHQEHDALPVDQKVYFIGIPYFDHLAKIESTHVDRVLLFIDQPLAEQRLLQWNEEYKKKFIETVVDTCAKHNYQLYVKPHPKQDTRLWKKAEQAGLCEIVDNNELEKVATVAPLVLGFYSTLLMPFAAFKHTTLVTYENHPPGNLLVSKPFVEAGVAHPIYDLEELHDILNDTDALHQQQLPHKEKFIQEWMYKFDGKAGERLRDILLSKDL